MPGFRSDHINLIAANLRDRYKSGFPILKELIQNADDAKACGLVFGYHPGFAGQSSHPLLQGPALWVLNDGEFKDSDKRAIQSFGLNSKAGESGAIGKFGLGMKSVFHLCEAFFYVAFDGIRPHGVILNPWFDPEDEDAFHNRWEEVADEDFERMHAIAAGHRQVEPGKSYLQLWLPLRMRAHVPQQNGKPYGAIIDKFPGDDPSQELAFLREKSLAQRVSSILPLLKKLESVEFAGSDSAPGFSLHLELDAGSRRVDHKSYAMVATGVVKENPSDRELLKFYVRQIARPTTSPFKELQSLDSWPKTMRQSEDGNREQVADKSEAEGAVMISHTDADVAHLQLRWAVFLPTEEGIQSYEASLGSGKRRYQIVLHGQFFVDAGRRGIGGFRHLGETQVSARPDLDDAELHVAWNQAIAQLVVLPQLLPALSEYVSKHDLADAEVEEITDLIAHAASPEAGGARASFCSIYREHLYRHHAWICELLPTGKQWRLLDQDRDHVLLRLPPPRAKDLTKPWAVMPGLRQISNAIYCDASASSLVPRFDDWDEERLLTVLQVDVDAGLCDRSGLEYLTAFLSTTGQIFLDTYRVQEALVQLVQRGLRTRPIGDFRRLRSSFQELVALVKPENRVCVGPLNPSSAAALDIRTLALLFSCETRMLVIPADLDSTETRATGKPSDEDFGAWFAAIDREICAHRTLDESESDEHSLRTVALLKAAIELLGLYGPKLDLKAQEARARIVRLHRRERILSALDVRTGIEYAESLESLEIIHGARRLLKQTANALDRFGHAKEFCLALKDETVYLITSETAGYIQRDGHPKVSPADDGTAILEALGKAGIAANLSCFEARWTLLKAVRQTQLEGDARRGLRYLLHGSPDGFMDDQARLWIDPGQGDSPWIKLWREVEPGSWFVLAEKIASDVPPNDWEKVGISQVEKSDVLRRLQDADDLAKIDGAKFSDAEREAILAAVEDESVWLRLPLHIDTAGSIECISADTFRDTGRNIPEQLSEGCRFIRRAQNHDHLQKQIQRISIWTSETTIRRALEREFPQQFWCLIVGEIANLVPGFHDDLPELRSTQWLPLANGGVISPEDVIDIEAMASEIDQLSSRCGYPFAGISGLHQDVRSHTEFNTLSRLFSAGIEGLSRLGQLMSEVPGYGVGSVSGLGADNLRMVADTLANLPRLPAWAIVAKAIRVFDAEAVGEHLLGEICKPLEFSEIIDTLREISISGAGEHHVVSFNLYLRQFALAGTDGRDRIRQLRLLSKAGTWQDANLLCVGAAGVVRKSQLDDTQARILAGLIFDNSRPTAAENAPQLVDPGDEFHHGDSLAKTLETYFRPWCDVMPTPPIGAFACLLGPNARQLGRELLKPHSMGWFTDRLGWVDPGQEADGKWRWMSRKSALEALDALDPRIKVTSDSCVDVLTINGDLLSVDLDAELDTLFAGAFNWRGGYTVDITLRRVPNLVDLAPQDLSSLLRRSASHLLKSAYSQDTCGIAPLWDELEKSDQLSLEVARDLILENLPFYLQQLKVAKRNTTLSAALATLKKLQHEKSEAASTNHAAFPEMERKVGEAKKHLARLMVEDGDVQRAILSGVRDRVKQSQYELSSIAFELFQNADDAVSEMQLLHKSVAQDSFPDRTIGRFIIEGDGAALRFIHWGRPINFTGQGAAANPAYQDDLENMLILSASDKDGTQLVTGKFGLGFKSVLLATDSPRIISADLRAKIIGGCLPERWTGPDLEQALAVLERHRVLDGPRLRPTLIELHVDSPEERQQILGRFDVLAGMQAVFSKEIRRISVQGQEREWRPVLLIDETPSIEIGTVRLPTKSGYAPGRLFVWRGRNGSVAMRLDSRGVVPFEGSSAHALPSIWVTGPTRETPASGLVLNANFDVDAGRGALAHGEGGQANLKLVREIAMDFARDLKLVVQGSRDDWETARDRLGLAQDVSAAAFWASFWKQAVQTSVDDDASLAAELLHHFGTCLLDRFSTLAGEIPNGMPGDLGAFVALDKIRLALASRWFPALPPLCGWSDLVGSFPVSGWIDETVADALEASRDTSDESRVPRLSVELIRSCVPDSRCSPATASTLFFVLANAHPFDQALIGNGFSTLLFTAEDGSWQLGSDLLKDRNTPEEGLCMLFAASRNILNGSYTSTARNFVIERGARWHLVPNTITAWIFRSSSPAAREAGLRYLLRGAQSFAVREQLRLGLIGTWLESIQIDSAVLAPFSPDERQQLVAMLNPGGLDFLPPTVEPIVTTVLHEAALERIFEWWTEERAELLPRYEKNFWPESVPRRFEDPAGEDRQSWMTLFALGLMQRLGRTRDFQNRGFIDFTDSKGWWPIFCNVRPQDNSDAWISILKGYAEQPNADEKYIRWMDCFPSLYRIARWMEAYSHVFLSLDLRTPHELAAYLAPNEDPVLDGSDILAPSLRNSLRLGQHLVVRELLRAGALKSDTAQSLAYMPNFRVRTLFTQIGYPSPETGMAISQILRSALGDRAGFHGDYDIPLLILAGSTDLQARVLDIRHDDTGFDDVSALYGMEMDDESLV